MVENPTMIITLLANSLPNRSTYFIQILLADTCITLSVELLRVSAVATAAVRSFVGPKLTEEERRTTWMGIRPFADPTRFQHAQILSGMVLYFIVFFVYATLAPITSIFIFICFLFMGAAYRHQVGPLSVSIGLFLQTIKNQTRYDLWDCVITILLLFPFISNYFFVTVCSIPFSSSSLSLSIPQSLIVVANSGSNL
jgi:hypothetical protein